MKLNISPAPHFTDRFSTRGIMLDVIIALVPALGVGIWIFGLRSLVVTVVCVAACMIFECLFQLLARRKNTIGDLSAALTGMILALNLPVTIPLWQAVFGCFIAIILVKMVFGGIGKNFANPAAAARVVMLVIFSGTMTQWLQVPVPFWANITLFATPSVDGITAATPLVLLGSGAWWDMPTNLTLFIGQHGGTIGETSELALLLGGIYLLVRRVISWHAPVGFIGTVFILAFLQGGCNTALQHILTGGLFLGAIFMATDYVSTPLTKSGRLVFGIGCGILTMVVRLFGGYPEGVSLAILFMNVLVPFINKLTAKKALGGKY